MSAELPILFSAPMVLAILGGRKTVTRRVVKRQPAPGNSLGWFDNIVNRPPAFGESRPMSSDLVRELRCPYGVPGDRLWLQEAHSIDLVSIYWARVTTLADGEVRSIEIDYETYAKLKPQKTVRLRRGRPGRFMPRWASRILLEVVSVRVERLQEITEADARAEGAEPAPFCKAGRPPGLEHVDAFEDLWDGLNGKRPGSSWADNPWVWRVEFRRLEP